MYVYNLLFFFFFSDGSINFLAHYRLVEPEKLESYAKAFVVEDRDMDTVINFDVTIRLVFKCILNVIVSQTFLITAILLML